MSDHGVARRVAVHGHFYQPPREHPWLDVVERDPSARPHHDWNARVTAECYGPVTAARLLGPSHGICGIVNTLDRISFNVGPTLFRWLDRERPGIRQRIVEADRRSAARQGGHGNAIAQPYVHAILPLQSSRDRRTLVHWGRTEFRLRFGRESEGMWLPETAVDRSTLGTLADAGLRFTVLAPGQVARIRPPGGTAWRPAAEALDPGCPLRVDLGRGRSLVAFVYDGALAHAVAFGGLLASGEAFAARLLEAHRAPPASGWSGPPAPRLAHVATDGESYGHHHRFGETALAAGLARIESALDDGARLGIAPELDGARVAACLGTALEAAVAHVPEAPAVAAADALGILSLARRLGITPDLWEAQTAFAPHWVGDVLGPAERPARALGPLAAALGFEPPPVPVSGALARR